MLNVSFLFLMMRILETWSERLRLVWRLLLSSVLEIDGLSWNLTFLHACVHAESLQPRQTLCDSLDRSPPGCSVRGILQARILEWVAMPSCRGSSWPRIKSTSLQFPALAEVFLPLGHLGSPLLRISGSNGSMQVYYIIKDQQWREFQLERC